MAVDVLMLECAGEDFGELRACFEKVTGRGGWVLSVSSSAQLFQSLDSGEWDLVVLDYVKGDGHLTGAALLEDIRSEHREVPIVAVAERGNVEIAAEAIHAGATDFLVRGARLGERVSTQIRKIRRIAKLLEEKRRLAEHNEQLSGEQERDDFIGDDPAIASILDRAQRIAPIPRPVLIIGERGTGKEILARMIHRRSGVRGPLLAINCAAFPDPLLESELFGHEKGAFSGADRAAAGKFELAHRGTLFLDEIGNMSTAFQQKILRAVEYGIFQRIGGHKDIAVQVRIIAATNADLAAKMEAGEFLRDLYDRLAFEVLEIPPLRRRPGDIEALARHFLQRFMAEIPELRGKKLSQAAIESLRRYDYPGNVRELKNIVERAVYRDITMEITPEDLGMEGAPALSRSASARGGFKERTEAFERQLILEAITEAEGNRAAAARSLELSYHQLRHYCKKHGL